MAKKVETISELEGKDIVNKVHDFKNKSNGEMLELFNMVEFVYQYYNNEANANRGEYNMDTQSRYQDAIQKCLTYIGLKNCIFEEIERRVREI